MKLVVYALLRKDVQRPFIFVPACRNAAKSLKHHSGAFGSVLFGFSNISIINEEQKGTEL